MKNCLFYHFKICLTKFCHKVSPAPKFLKPSVCTEGSQHLHETPRINSGYTKSDRKFFLEAIFIFLCLFFIFSCLKPGLWIFTKKYFLVTQILKCLTGRKHSYWQNKQNFVKQSWNDQKDDFTCLLIKNNKTFSQKKL